jgi:hypothetical protein
LFKVHESPFKSLWGKNLEWHESKNDQIKEKKQQQKKKKKRKKFGKT